MKKDFMTLLALKHPVNKQPVKKRRDWTHVLASDGTPFTSPALARHYNTIHNLPNTIKFYRPE